MKSQKGGKSSIIERLKAEIVNQTEQQDEIEEFTFSNINIGQFTPEINQIFKKYTNLISLEFKSCNLTSLENFPNIPRLAKLSLEQNKLTGDALTYIADNFKELQFLSLTQNKINTFDELQCLSKLKELKQLDLQENAVANLPNYREIVMTQICTGLIVLDNRDQAGDEIAVSDDDDDYDDAEIDDTDDDEDYEEEEDEEYDEADDDDDDEPKKKKKKQGKK